MIAAIYSAIMNSTILDSAILVFPLKLTHTCQDWFICTLHSPPFAQKNPSLIHSDSTWWWPSWILPSWILPSTWIQPSWILPCWIQTPCFLLSDSLKNTLTPLWLWLKLIQSDSNSFILTQLDDGGHLGFSHLGHKTSATNSIDSNSFILLSDSLKNTLTPLWLWLKLIQSDSNSFILTQLDDGSHLEFHHLGFSHLSFSSQTHSHLPRLVPTICTKKTSLTLPSQI